MEVQQGSSALITCSVIKSHQSGMTVTWEDSPETVTETSDGGSLYSVLTLNNVQSDSLYTCLVKSKEFPESEESSTTVSFKIYGNQNPHRIYQMLYDFIRIALYFRGEL